MMDKILENNYILYALIGILFVLLIIYTIMLIEIRKQKRLENAEDEEEVPMTKAEALALEEEKKKNVIILDENIKDIEKDATYIPDLKKSISLVSDGVMYDNYQFKDVDSVRVLKSDDIKEITPEEIAQNENIAFGKDFIFDKSINEDIKIENDDSKFEKTEVIDLDEIYNLVDKLNKKE